MHNIVPQTALDILDQVIWLNQHLKRGKVIWCIPQAVQAGVHKIRDIYEMTTDQFLRYQQLTDKYGLICTQLQCNGILASIP